MIGYVEIPPAVFSKTVYETDHGADIFLRFPALNG